MNLTLKQFKTKGFTLVEILIVVIIVGLLSGIAVSKLGDSKERAVQSAKKSAAAEMNKAIQAQYIKGNMIEGFIAGAVFQPTSSSNCLPVLSLASILAANPPNNAITQESKKQLRIIISDTTPRGGFLTLTGTDHKSLEVVYNEGTFTGTAETDADQI